MKKKFSLFLCIFKNFIGMLRSPIALLDCSDAIAFRTSDSYASGRNMLLVLLLCNLVFYLQMIYQWHRNNCLMRLTYLYQQ